MIFTRTIRHTFGPPGRSTTVEAEVDFYVDENALAQELGPRALGNRTGKSKLRDAVIAEVRTGTQRTVSLG